MKRMKKYTGMLCVMLFIMLWIMPAMPVSAESAWYTVDGVVGGQIQFEPETGEITDCETTVTSAVIPVEIGGVAVTSIGSNAFESCSSLTEVRIPESVTSIGSYAFYNCSSLTEVTIPEGVTSIEGYTFRGCSSLTEVTISEGVTSVGNSAFKYCSKLAEVTIPSSVTSIKSYAFEYCSNLERVILPASLSDIGRGVFSGCEKLTSAGPLGSDSSIEYGWTTSIPDYAFHDCSSLTEVMIPESVTSIGDFAFRGCSSLSSVTIPAGVTSIGRYAFRGCSGLSSVTIPEGVTSIEGYTFSGCSSLSSVTIPEGVTSIGDYAFEGCSSLSSMTIPAGVTSIGENAVNNSNLTSLGPIGSGCSIEYEWTEIPENVFKGNNSLTNVIIGEEVTAVGASAFRNCSELKNITIASSVTSMGESVFAKSPKVISVGPIGSGCSIEYGWTEEIPDNAFSNCTYLEMAVFPDTMKKIGASAFYGCTSLESIHFPAGINAIGASAFETCVALKTITLTDGLTAIEDSTFSGCSGLTEIVIPENVTSLGVSAFAGCTALATVSLPDKITSIGDEAFRECSSLQEITITGAVTSVGNALFYGCSSLENIVLPEGVTSIGNQAFYGCSSLEYAIIPDGVITIGDEAFRDCTGMKDAELPESVTGIGSAAFRNCDALTEVKIPSGVTILLDDTFRACANLSEVEIEEGLETLGASVFYNCENLSKVSIPASLASIGENVFYNCQQLTSAGPVGSDSALEFGWTEEIPGWFTEFQPETLVLGPQMSKVTTDVKAGTRLEIYNPNFADFEFVEDDSPKTLTTIAGFSGSKVEIYARNNGYTFEALHETQLDEGYEETCDEPGRRDAWYCEECDQYYMEIYHINVITEAGRTIMPAHKAVQVKRKEPACVETGNIEYWYCDVCETYFLNGGLTTEITEADTVIAATGHFWEHFYTIDVPATETEPGIQSIYCNVCDEKKESSTIPVVIGGTLTDAEESFNLADAKITWSNTKNVYTGAEIEAKPMVSIGSKILTEGVDYTLSYENNVNAGETAIVKITGVGNYTGEASDSFVILPRILSGAVIEVIGASYKNGSVNPSVIVSLDGESISRNEDYTFHFSNANAPGIATVTIVGKGNYTGTISREFEIIDVSSSSVTAYLAGGTDYRNVIHGKNVICEGAANGDSYWYACTLKKDGKVLKTGGSNSESLGPNLSFDTSDYGTGTYTVEYAMYNYYADTEIKVINSGGSWIEKTITTYSRGSYVSSGTYTFHVAESTDGDTIAVTELEILEPVIVDSRTLFFNVEATPEKGDLSELMWSSSDESVAVVEDGIVTLKKAGNATITASVNGVTAEWLLEIDTADLSVGKIAGIDEETGFLIVIFNGEVLINGTDYICEIIDFGNDMHLFKVTGCNLYTGTLMKAFYRENGAFVGDDELFWAVDEGTLRLYVNGDMHDFTSADDLPWNPEEVENIELYGDIEHIGNYVFSGCDNLDSITFDGDAPEFAENSFSDSELIIYYPADKEGWTEDVMQDYGGDLTWVMQGGTPNPTETPEVTGTPNPTEAPDVTGVPNPTGMPGEKDNVTDVFSDVYQDWYTDYVQYVYDNNLMTGIKGTDRFEPNANITKAQVAQVLYNMEGQPAVEDTKVFDDLSDVYEVEWYADAVSWAYSTGVVTGDLKAMKFFPNDDVTREQLALMMYRYAQYKVYDTSATSDFAGLVNADKVANWSEAGVRWAVGTGLISGIETDGVKDLAPQGNASRAQVAAILQRFCKAYEK